MSLAFSLGPALHPLASIIALIFDLNIAVTHTGGLQNGGPRLLHWPEDAGRDGRRGSGVNFDANSYSRERKPLEDTIILNLHVLGKSIAVCAPYLCQ